MNTACKKQKIACPKVFVIAEFGILNSSRSITPGNGMECKLRNDKQTNITWISRFSS
jgi:hypothetical protein